MEVTGVCTVMQLFQPSEENCWKKWLHVGRGKFPYFSVLRRPDP